MKILVGFDNSDASVAAVRYAVGHARAVGGRIVLVMSLHGDSNEDDIQIEAAEEALKKAAEMVVAEGVACEEHLLVRGLSPGEDLVAFAKEEDIDEIVIGIKRRSKVSKLLFGSNAQMVILNAHCPVLTVK